MMPFRSVIGGLLVLQLAACATYQAAERTGKAPFGPALPSERPALDRLLTPGDIQVAEGHLQALGFDPGPVDGMFTVQTQAAIRAFQARYGIPISGLLDRETRIELLPGLDPKPSP